MSKGKFFDELVVAAGLDPATYPTDAKIVEWVATLHREAGRPSQPKPDPDPAAEAMKAGLDAVEKAMAPPRSVEHILAERFGPDWRQAKIKARSECDEGTASLINEVIAHRRVREREALAHEIVRRLVDGYFVTRGTADDATGIILECLADCDDPGAYDRIPGEEEQERVTGGVGIAEINAHLASTDGVPHPTPAYAPAFPGEVALRDQPAWFSPRSPLTVKAETAVAPGRKHNWVAPSREDRHCGSVCAACGKIWLPGASDEECSGVKPAPDLLKAAEDVLLVYACDLGDEPYRPALEALRRAVAAEKERRSKLVNVAGGLAPYV